VLWSLDRETFNFIVKEASVNKRNKYESLLSRIQLLDSMDSYERMAIAEALRPEKFRAGDLVIRQGDEGDTFYFVEDGTAVALKVAVAQTDQQAW